MVGPVQNSPRQASLSRRQRSQRFSVDLAASVEVDGVESQARLQDISETGAALIGETPEMTNEQFLDLHVEGYSRLKGRVVREFSGGYALQFADDTGPAITPEELEEFRKRASVGG